MQLTVLTRFTANQHRLLSMAHRKMVKSRSYHADRNYNLHDEHFIQYRCVCVFFSMLATSF